MSDHGEPEARRQVALIGAASSIGIRPYDDRQQARHLDRAPAALRELGLAERLGADDLGDLVAPPYRDFTRRPGRVRNEDDIVAYSGALAERVAHGMDGGRFVLVLGGDCSIVLGTLLGAAGRAGRIGLAYIDGHADFATPDESQTGSAASMCLALAVGRGNSPLARLAGPTPLVRHPRALGMELTIYGPALDPGGVCGTRLTALLEQVLSTDVGGEHR